MQEYAPLGTAGGIYHFRDQIMRGNPRAFFVFNSDVCCDFPVKEMAQFHSKVIAIVCCKHCLMAVWSVGLLLIESTVPHRVGIKVKG